MFKFIYEGDGYSNELTFGVDGECLTHDQVSDWFNQFLRGCGYRYEGEYGLVTPEEEVVLARYDRQKAKAEFMDKVYGDEKIPDDYALAM